MKKIVALALTLLMVFSLSACGNTQEVVTETFSDREISIHSDDAPAASSAAEETEAGIK